MIETLKIGIKNAASDWIAFLESDDTIEADYLKKKFEIIKKNPDIKFIFNDVNIFGNECDTKGALEYYEKLHGVLDKKQFPCFLKDEFLKRNIIPTFSCVMVQKKLLNSLNFDKCALPKCLDYYLWTQIAKDNKFYFLNEKLTNWRRTKGSYINKKEVKVLKDKYFRKIQLYENLNKSKVKKIVRRFYFYSFYSFFTILSGIVKDVSRKIKEL